jgi:hypothetical protein
MINLAPRLGVISRILAEFPEYPVETLPIDIPLWLLPHPWHNDPMPLWWDVDSEISLGIDHPNPTERETPGPRFIAYDAALNVDIYQGDDWDSCRTSLQAWWDSRNGSRRKAKEGGLQ